MDISGNWTSYIAKVCLGFAIYEVQLPQLPDLSNKFFISLFIGLICRIVFLAERQRSNYSRIYGYSVACILFVHFVINIGMTIGLLPTIGIPLPFISYGGSSLLGFTTLLFIFLNLDSYRLDILR